MFFFNRQIVSYQKLENEMQKSLKIMKKRLDKTEKQCYNVRENKEEFFALTVTPVALPVDMFLPLLAFFVQAWEPCGDFVFVRYFFRLEVLDY